MEFLLLSKTAAFTLMGALAAVPLIIHLINMMRHRRVKWAAMEFLLLSYKKQRNWIFLKQLLLLLIRMAAMVAAVALLARLDTTNQLAALFGGSTTHHYVLIDDSYSMSDEGTGLPAFERAKDVVSVIARRAREEPTRQRMTLIRFSRASLAPPPDTGPRVVDTRLDVSDEIIDSGFDELLEEKRRTFEVSELAVGPGPALNLVQQLVAGAKGENARVYLVSDFRRADWRNPADVRKSCQGLEKAGAELHMIRCVAQHEPNLAITHLAPADQTRAAGVPLYVVLKVKNYGRDIVRKVTVKVTSMYYDPAGETEGNEGKLKSEDQELPIVVIDRIDPGETATRRVQVYFPTAGKHVVQASLPDDAVAADNVRRCAVDFPAGVPVLLVDDGSSVRNDAYYVSSVFDPGDRAETGMRPKIVTSAFLRDSSLDTLRGFQAIYMFNVPRLDETAVDNLKQYVREGGGLAIFLGPQNSLDFEFYNNLAAEEDPLFPVPLEKDELLPPPSDTDVPDFYAEEHPVFQALSGESNVYLRDVTLERYFMAKANFSPPPQSSTQIIARLRNRFPLAVARQFGDGRVVAFLTTAAPTWNSWARDDSFGLFILNLQSYLASPAQSDRPLRVGEPVLVQIDAKSNKELSFYVPRGAGNRPLKIVRNAESPQGESPVMNAAIGQAEDGVSRSGETDRSGIYEAWFRTQKNEIQVDRLALNVDPSEGDLATIEPTGLASAMSPVIVELQQAEEYEYAGDREYSSNWTNVLLILLICLLLGEQALAYSASYHPPRGGTP